MRRAGYPCRVSLRDADAGEELILLNHVSHDVAGPFRTTYAIYVRKDAEAPASYRGRGARLSGQPHARRCAASAPTGLLKDGLLAMPGEADAKIRALFEAARGRHHPRALRPLMAASSRASKGTEHGEPCNPAAPG